jgi:ribose-phosphate pyrophosphokinase
MNEEMCLVGGSGSPRLSAAVCRYLGIEPGRGEAKRFSDGNIFVRLGENVRGRQVFVLQSTAFPPNDNFMELLFWVDACRRASAASVTAVMPYFSYAKGDKKDEPRVSIRARVCADALESAGVDRVVTLDLHAGQIQGFFRVPVDDLYALPVLGQAVRELGLEDLVVVAPDSGRVRMARQYARFLGAGMALADKERIDHSERATVLEVIGEVEGRTALVVDDFTVSGGTLIQVAEALMARGARQVYAAVSQGVFAPGAMARLEASPIRKLLTTDAVETQPEALSEKVQVVSVAPLLGEAIGRIFRRESVSVLFPQ